MLQNLTPFRLERFFAQWEFKVEHLLSPSDCESLTLRELLALADADGRERWERLSLGYTESSGHPVLRAEIALLYETIDADDVLVLTPEEGILLAMHALLEPGDHVIATAPAYQSLHESMRAIGCELTLWRVTPAGGRWQLDLDLLARSITSRTRLLLVNFPHNPTGYSPTADEWQEILELARRHDLFVFSDEMYRFLEHDESRRLAPACDRYDKAITLSGLSKAFAAPGLRIGWLATRQRALLERCAQLKDYTTICHSAPSEILGLITLRAREAILGRNRAIVHGNLAYARRFFAQRAASVRWLEPDGGSIAFPEWIGPGSVEALCQDALDRHGVLLVSGAMFDAPGAHFRLGLGRRNFVEGLDRARPVFDRA